MRFRSSSSRAFASWYAIRSRDIWKWRSRSAHSSGVVFWIFRFFAKLVLQQFEDPRNVALHVTEQTHDSRDVLMLDRRFDGLNRGCVGWVSQVALADR